MHTLKFDEFMSEIMLPLGMDDCPMLNVLWKRIHNPFYEVSVSAK